MKGCNFVANLDLEGIQIELYIKARPGLQQFLTEMSRLYELVVFTSSPKAIADGILKHIDKSGLIKHRLYRDKCLNLNQVYYLKDMRKLNRDPSNVVFVDVILFSNSVQHRHRSHATSQFLSYFKV